MYCNNCGNQLPDDTVYCSQCGQMVNSNVFDINNQIFKTGILAAALVGTGIGGLIAGSICLKKVQYCFNNGIELNKKGKIGRGLAIGGKWGGLVTILVCITYLVCFFLTFSWVYVITHNL